ncbi:uncharacterized protein LOC127284937 [Leptopilina boulardi]|uniref:uncharacterized protein LOC127284937 n=1 Tax=Leptopilina boulardi TaxID=63433 RepID=UPI0021F5F123|nr:uncharacterized protein LOC127284937 [Leptopilina boulardi]
MRNIVFFIILYKIFYITSIFGRPADNTAYVKEETFDNIFQAAHKCHRFLEDCMRKADFKLDVQNRCFEMCVTELSESKFICNKNADIKYCHHDLNDNYYFYNVN